MIQITEAVTIPAHDIWLEYSRASGPGGQHVNCTNSRVTLCFAPAQCAALSTYQTQRILRFLHNRISADGVLRISCDSERSQSANRTEVTSRFQKLLGDALRPRTPRRATRPTRGSKERRLQSKRKQGLRKQSRRKPRPDEME